MGDIAVDGAELGCRKRHRHIFGTGVLREALPAGTELKAVLAADDAVIGLAVLGFATIRDDRDRRGDVEGGERAFEAAVRLDGEICDGGHDKVSWIDRDHPDGACTRGREPPRSEEHTSEHPSLMRISYAVFCLTTKTQ